MKIAALQLCSGLDYEQNLRKIKNLIQEAKILGVKAVFLPEVFYSMGDGQAPTPHLIEGNADGPHYRNIQKLAVDSGMYLLGGSAATLVGDKIYNRAYFFAPDGTDLGHYDKRNLFSCELEKQGPSGLETKKIDEGVIYSRGTEGKIIQAGDLRIGASICFDLRFPMLYREYIQGGANLMTIASAFTVPTGKAHWHVLVRARAIENQCFVVASAQWGRHNDRMQTYGHSLIVSPWGEVLADAKEGERIVFADIDLGEIEKVRKAVKVF